MGSETWAGTLKRTSVGSRSVKKRSMQKPLLLFANVLSHTRARQKGKGPSLPCSLSTVSVIARAFVIQIEQTKILNFLWNNIYAMKVFWAKNIENWVRYGPYTLHLFGKSVLLICEAECLGYSSLNSYWIHLRIYSFCLHLQWLPNGVVQKCIWSVSHAKIVCLCSCVQG